MALRENPRYTARCRLRRLVVAMILLAGCGTETTSTTGETTSTVRVSSIAGGSTTTTSTTLPASTTSPTEPSAPAAGLLLATDDGIDLVVDGEITRLLQGRSVAFALPDLTGGVVFQEAGQYEQGWPPQPVPIEWVTAVGAGPVVLVGGEGANALTPIQVAWVDDRPQLLYRRMTVLDEDDQVVHLLLRDLSSGTERVLGIIGAYESSWTGVDIGGDRVVVAWVGYAEEGACAGVTGLNDLLSLGEDEWVGTICGGECCAYGPNPGCGFGVPCPVGPTGSIRAAINPDGSAFALLTADTAGSWRLDEIDLSTEEVRLVTERPIQEDEWPTWLDYDGSEFLVGFVSGDGDRWVIHVDEAGEIIESIDARSASFWMMTSEK